MYHKYRLLIHAAITALIMAFIFYQSSLPAILSSEMSGHLERIVAWILGKPSESVTFAVRKAAHDQAQQIMLCLKIDKLHR